MKKVLLIETTLVSAFIAAFFSIASMSNNNVKTSVQSTSHASTSSHSIYYLGEAHPQP